MQLGDLYNFALIIILVALVVGVGVLTLDKFSTATGVTAAAQTAINAGRTELGAINTTWLGLIVTIAVLALILGLVVQGYGSFRGR